jgi:hypothetical protein
MDAKAGESNLSWRLLIVSASGDAGQKNVPFGQRMFLLLKGLPYELIASQIRQLIRKWNQ